MPKFDLNAAVADVEAAARPFEFEWGDESFELPGRIDLRVGQMLNDGRLIDALRQLLGDQFARFDAVPKVFDELALTSLFAAYGEHVGASPGKSAPLPR